MFDSKKLGVKITSLRKSVGYSQEKLAELLRISPQAISKWENGHALPDISFLPALAQIFNCTVDSIIIPAYTFDENIEMEKPNVLEQQAEHIAKHVLNKMEEKLTQKEQYGFSDDIITETVLKKHNEIKSVIITKDKTSRTNGDIRTPITVSGDGCELKLLDITYHKRREKFNGYVLLNDYHAEIPTIYHINREKRALLIQDITNGFICGNNFGEDSEDGKIIRDNYKTILKTVADFHGTFWENGGAFERLRLPWHFEYKENMLAWISDAMERPFKKYKKDEENGKISKTGVGKNNITQKELDYYNEALRFLRNEYIKLIEDRFNIGKNITVIHGDLHPGQIFVSSANERYVVMVEPQNVRIGLPTEDLAMLVALHISLDSMGTNDYDDTRPLLDYYYECLCKKVDDYTYDTFMNDYKISIAENLFFPIRLINNGITDFWMRDKALKAFEVFVLNNN